MSLSCLYRIFLAATLLAAASWSRAAIVIDEIYSNADGTVQYLVLRLENTNGQQQFAGKTLTATHGGATVSTTFDHDLPSVDTANKRVLIATAGFTKLGLIPADLALPERFIATSGGTLDFIGITKLTYPALPTDGVNAYYANQTTAPNLATNFAGQSASVAAAAVTAIEFYNAALDHYFISALAPDIDALDSGRIGGWTRTGRGFKVFPSQASGGAGVSPVCRFYIPPQHGNSHFFSASIVECGDILAKIPTNPNYSGYVYETPSAFYAALPDTGTGACPPNTIPVYRLWNQRADSNHRYTADPGIKAAMIAKGYAAEGYGPDAVSLCSPAAVLVDAAIRASGFSQYAPGCDGVPATGTLYVDAEVEPYVAVNPANPNNFIGVWQQDRWSNGGARGLGGAFSLDGGGTWTRTSAPFSRCSGGNAGNGGNYERATDPWVTFAPDGTAYQSAFAFSNQANGDNAILVARSADGGRTWSNPVTLRRDSGQNANDKESVTADPTDARYVYAVWDRLTGNNGPAWFARTVDGGASWETARSIYDPGINSQTINNQVLVLPDGTLVLFFTELANVGPANVRLRIMRSTDKGVTWSPPTTISDLQSVGTNDAVTGEGIRDGSILGSIAAGKDGSLAVAWQDSRFAGGAHDDIAFVRSADGGLTWSTPLRINAFPDFAAFLPAIAIREDGMIGVTYYDRTAVPASLHFWLTNYRMATSTDGVTWQVDRLAGAFDYARAPLAGGRFFLGDYMGLATVGATFLPFFGIVPGLSVFEGGFAGPSDIAALLRRSAASVTTSGRESTTLKATTAATAPMTADTAQRIDANARRVIAGRAAAGILGRAP
jgi:BNR repeat-like domain